MAHSNLKRGSQAAAETGTRVQLEISVTAAHYWHQPNTAFIWGVTRAPIEL